MILRFTTAARDDRNAKHKPHDEVCCPKCKQKGACQHVDPIKHTIIQCSPRCSDTRKQQVQYNNYCSHDGSKIIVA